MTSISFDPNKYEPESSDRFQPIPAGTYVCIIEAEAVKPTRDGSGLYLELTLVIAEGTHAKRKVFDRPNLKNASPDAVRIGLARLSAICRALDINMLQDTNQLVHGRLNVTIGLEKDKATGQPTGRNVVLGYSKYEKLNALGQPYVVPSAVAPTGIANLSDDVPF